MLESDCVERWLWQVIRVGDPGGRRRNEAGPEQFKQNEIRSKPKFQMFPCFLSILFQAALLS